MTGKLYGVGVGPGDPELITLKALRLTKEADILAFPGENPKESVAYRIMKGAYPEIDSKQMISLPMPMIKDREELKRVHDEGAKIIAEWLEKGKNVVFLTLGDPTVYSTYIYVHKRVEQLGYGGIATGDIDPIRSGKIVQHGRSASTRAFSRSGLSS